MRKTLSLWRREKLLSRKWLVSGGCGAGVLLSKRAYSVSQSAGWRSTTPYWRRESRGAWPTRATAQAPRARLAPVAGGAANKKNGIYYCTVYHLSAIHFFKL